MNLERRIRKLNRMLEDELGSTPLYAWVACNSSEMMHPCQVLDSSGAEIYDVLCQCGTNVAIHGRYCKVSVSVVRGEMQPRLPKYMGWWVLAFRRPVLDWEADELRRAIRPAVLWEPVPVKEHPLGYALWPHEPDERLTKGLIKMVREYRSVPVEERIRQFRKEYAAREQRRRERARGISREQFGMTINPQEKGGVSFPPVQKQGAIQ